MQSDPGFGAAPGDAVVIDYTNWRGERRRRSIIPRRLYWGSSNWHPRAQWLLEAIDEDGSIKAFAMKDIHEWTER